MIEDEDLVANARGPRRPVLAGLRALQADHPAVGDVRGLGSCSPWSSSSRASATAGCPTRTSRSGSIAEALDRKLIVLSAGTYANVARIIPPLVTTADEVDQALRILDESLAAAGA